CDNIPNAQTLTANDNCGSATVSVNDVITAGSCANSYTIARTWTATDGCALTTIHTQTITVQDTTAPTFVEALPSDITVECDNIPVAQTLTANDNCGSSIVMQQAVLHSGSSANNHIIADT